MRTIATFRNSSAHFSSIAGLYARRGLEVRAGGVVGMRRADVCVDGPCGMRRRRRVACRWPMAGWGSHDGRRAPALLPRDRGLVPRVVQRAHPRPGGRLAGDQLRLPRAGRGADRFRQDAGGLPLRRWTGWPPGRRPPSPQQRCRVLYVSPLKALAVDVERNLRGPLVGIGQAAARLGQEPRTCGWRSARETPPRPTAGRSPRGPPDILITTPESLFLMLTSSRARGADRRRDGDPRRGARGRGHQARRASRAVAGAARRSCCRARPSASGCRRRCDRWTRWPATSRGAAHGRRSCSRRPTKELDLSVVVPVADMAELGELDR